MYIRIDPALFGLRVVLPVGGVPLDVDGVVGFVVDDGVVRMVVDDVASATENTTWEVI